MSDCKMLLCEYIWQHEKFQVHVYLFTEVNKLLFPPTCTTWFFGKCLCACSRSIHSHSRHQKTTHTRVHRSKWNFYCYSAAQGSTVSTEQLRTSVLLNWKLQNHSPKDQKACGTIKPAQRRHGKINHAKCWHGKIKRANMPNVDMGNMPNVDIHLQTSNRPTQTSLWETPTQYHCCLFLRESALICGTLTFRGLWWSLHFHNETVTVLNSVVSSSMPPSFCCWYFPWGNCLFQLSSSLNSRDSKHTLGAF